MKIFRLCIFNWFMNKMKKIFIFFYAYSRTKKRISKLQNELNEIESKEITPFAEAETWIKEENLKFAINQLKQILEL